MLQATTPSLQDPQLQSHQIAQALNRTLHSFTAKLTAGLSPVALSLAFSDWALNLATSPGTHAWLLGNAQQRLLEMLTAPSASSPPPDQRFASEAWNTWPYQTLAHGFRTWDGWCRDAASLPGMTPHHADMVKFFTGQWLDMASPSNWPVNPEVSQAITRSGGQSLLRGLRNWADDWRRQHNLPTAQDEASHYLPGQDVAITPGKVVYRNHLIELIQYSPSTDEVYAEPVLIVPSWIMKYYILDLSPHNSMVRYLVSQGHTVFIVSWRNPDADDAGLSMDDYLHLGVFDALAAIKSLIPHADVHAAGYCLGGTLLAIAAAALSRPGQIQDADHLPTLKSVSMLAAQVDFREPGEIGVLIDPIQVKWLEELMAEQGYLSGRQMAASFQFLHARELVWTRQVREYLMGEREHTNDLMAWNADVTRMPATMHSEYLNSLFVRNDLAEGHYRVEGRVVSLMDLRMPLFAVGTERDHVSPWKSVYKLRRLTETELTFLLTSGGHNAGIVSEPGHAHRSYRVQCMPGTAAYLPPQDFMSTAAVSEGSWWPQWHDWIASHSSALVPARQIDPKAVLAEAPGDYVMVRYAD